MASTKHGLLAVVLASLIAGCGHDHAAGRSQDQTPPKSGLSSQDSALVPPAKADDVAAWRAFIGKAILAETKDSKQHPYAFVIPARETADGDDERKSDALTIRNMLGRTAFPDNMLAVTGPDSVKVAQVLVTAFKGLDRQTARGLKVLYVGTPSASAPAQAAVRAAGAEFLLRPMRAP